jgi:hypothetical protein
MARTPILGAGLAASVLLVAVVFSANAQPPAAVGGEFQVNTYTTSYQLEPNVAIVPNGSFIVVWTSGGSQGTDSAGSSVQGQRYGADGSPQGAQFQVNTYTTNLQRFPSVAADADGDFVVVWHSYGSPGTDTSDTSIQGRRFASDGSPQAAQFQVNDHTPSHQLDPSVAVAPDGRFVVAWHSYTSPGTDSSYSSVQGQRYASDGSPQGAQFQVNTYTTEYQFGPSVAVEADGDFIVVWDNLDFSAERRVRAQRFAANGSTQGAEFQVNTASGNAEMPDVASAPDGRFVVAWTGHYANTGTDDGPFSIQAQRFASNGSPQGAQFQVNVYTTSFQAHPSVTVDADGDFSVAWLSDGSFGSDSSIYSIQARRYASDGSTQGSEFQVNSYTTGLQNLPSVASDPDGDFIVVWHSPGSLGTDTSDHSVQGQRYRIPVLVPALSRAPTLVLGAVLLLVGCRLALQRRA